jgi:hypothetical protein
LIKPARIAVLAVLSGALVAVSQGNASADTNSLSTIPQSSSFGSSASSAVSGVLADGTTVAQPVAGDIVVLVAYPSEEAEDAQPLNTWMPLQEVSQTTTDSSGAFTLKVPTTTNLTADESSAGVVNFMVNFPNDPTRDAVSFSREVAQTFTGSYLFGAPDPESEQTTSDGGGSSQPGGVGRPTTNAPATLRLGSFYDTTPADASATLPATTDTTPADPDPTPDGGGALGCAQIPLKSYTHRVAAVGQFFSSNSTVTSTYHYSSGSDSSIGMGISVSGKYGTWSDKGERDRSSSATQSYPKVTGQGGWLWQTYFGAKKWHVVCDYGFSQYQMRGGPWEGGAPQNTVSSLSLPTGTASKCVPEPAGGGMTKKNTKAIKWTNGFSMAGPIGLDLSISTGYSTDAEQSVTFHAGGGHLCGRGDFPAGTPYILDARN